MLTTNDPNPVAIEMATVDGARAALWEKESGSLEEGICPGLPHRIYSFIAAAVEEWAGLEIDRLPLRPEMLREE